MGRCNHLPLTKTNSDIESLPLYLVALSAMSSGTNIWSLDDILKIGQLKWWFRKWGLLPWWVSVFVLNCLEFRWDVWFENNWILLPACFFPLCLENFWDVLFYQRGTYLTCMIPYRLNKQAFILKHFRVFLCAVLRFVSMHKAIKQSILLPSLSSSTASCGSISQRRKRPAGDDFVVIWSMWRLFWQRLWVEIVVFSNSKNMRTWTLICESPQKNVTRSPKKSLVHVKFYFLILNENHPVEICFLQIIESTSEIDVTSVNRCVCENTIYAKLLSDLIQFFFFAYPWPLSLTDTGALYHPRSWWVVFPPPPEFSKT